MNLPGGLEEALRVFHKRYGDKGVNVGQIFKENREALAGVLWPITSDQSSTIRLGKMFKEVEKRGGLGDVYVLQEKYPYSKRAVYYFSQFVGPRLPRPAPSIEESTVIQRGYNWETVAKKGTQQMTCKHCQPKASPPHGFEKVLRAFYESHGDRGAEINQMIQANQDVVEEVFHPLRSEKSTSIRVGKAMRLVALAGGLKGFKVRQDKDASSKRSVIYIYFDEAATLPSRSEELDHSPRAARARRCWHCASRAVNYHSGAIECHLNPPSETGYRIVVGIGAPIGSPPVCRWFEYGPATRFVDKDVNEQDDVMAKELLLAEERDVKEARVTDIADMDLLAQGNTVAAARPEPTE